MQFRICIDFQTGFKELFKFELIKIRNLSLRHGCLPMFDRVCLLITGSITVVCELTLKVRNTAAIAMTLKR